MKGSILIYGGTTALRHARVSTLLTNLELTADEVNPDMLVITPEGVSNTISIDKIRELIKYIGQLPYINRNKCVIINSADRLTTQAQNALLKTLEETPSYATIILETKNLKALLPTVVSRCQKINAAETSQSREGVDGTELGAGHARANSYTDSTDAYANSISESQLAKMLSMTLGQRLSYAAELAKEESEALSELLDTMVRDLQQQIARNIVVEKAQQAANAHNAHLILQVKNDLENTNINTKLALEYLVLNLK